MVYAIYIASILGALALMLMLPSGRTPASRDRAGVGRKLGALLGCATLGGLWLALYPLLPANHGIAGGGWAMAYFYIFASLGMVSAIMVITHPKPVYSALWFVMVVLSSAGIFLLLHAEFMAFAMVIIYGGAILVTYVFVIMLATQNPGDSAEPIKTEADPNRSARLSLEPALACVAGFLLLAVLLSVYFQEMHPNHAAYARGWSDETIAQKILTQRPQQRLQQMLTTDPPQPAPLVAGMGDMQRVKNVERLGLDLFRSHPLGLELAGVILLVSLVGAVVIARMRVETERNDERMVVH